MNFTTALGVKNCPKLPRKKDVMNVSNARPFESRSVSVRLTSSR